MAPILHHDLSGQAGRGAAPPLFRETTVLRWALIFFVIALIAALLGFGGIAGTAAGIAKIIFFVFLVLLAVSLLMHVFSGRRPPV